MEKKSLTGIVERGKALGRTLGYPTANIYGVEDADVPDGVYAIEAAIDGVDGTRTGMANLGYRPTVDKTDRHRVLEFHLFDFGGDLYGRRATVRMCRYIRPEKVFSGTDDLRRQLQEDEVDIKKFFACKQEDR